MRIYAIGDVHGHLDMLQMAHSFIGEDRRRCGDTTAPVVHLGDYCDRGPDSAGVYQFLIDGQNSGQPWRFALGNHDRLFRGFLDDAISADARLRCDYSWLTYNMGGQDTLRSYGMSAITSRSMDQLHADALQCVPNAHLEFLAGLEPIVEFEHLVFVHAGIRPGIPFELQKEDDLVWIREEFLDDTRDHGKIIVHGHTPVDAPEHRGNRVNLDTGAAYSQPLTAAVFEGSECWVLTATGRRYLSPTLGAIF